MSKCVLIFISGMAVSLATYAFFNQMMQMPQQAMTYGSMMMMGNPPQTCDCSCPQPK